MNKRRNRRNWLILILMFAFSLTLGWQNGGWLGGLIASVAVALVSYAVLAKWGVL